MMKLVIEITLEAVQFTRENINWVSTLESISHERHKESYLKFVMPI